KRDRSSRSGKRLGPALFCQGFRAVAPDVQGYGGSAVPADVPAYPQTEIWAGLVGLLDGSGIETAAMYL
ncbi:MAG TPA: hypothetical protein VNO32_42240, partial [Candidatus Acidoferrum sp.]|nr:hypothetical protein [Candidatus Acidoferrum sp.]